MRTLRLLVAVTLVAIAGAGLLAGCSSNDSDIPSTTVGDTLSVADFESVIAQGAVVIDVRTPSEYADGHLQGARNIDVQGDFAAALATLDHDATYALYCRSGVRSSAARQAMKAAGFTHVVDLSGGILAWTQAGRPVVTG